MTRNGNDRIGIVGAGITGAATAYYVSEKNPDHEITVFERDDDVGGRLQTLSVADRQFEAGGKFLHTDDEFCTEFVAEFGLSRADPAAVDDSAPPAMGREKTVGIWDGEQFLVNLEGSMLGSVGHLLRSYPLSLYRLYRESTTVDERLDELADRIESGEAFRTPSAMTDAVDIEDWFRGSAREQLTDAGVAEQAIDEVVAATAQTTFGYPRLRFAVLDSEHGGQRWRPLRHRGR